MSFFLIGLCKVFVNLILNWIEPILEGSPLAKGWQTLTQSDNRLEPNSKFSSLG